MLEHVRRCRTVLLQYWYYSLIRVFATVLDINVLMIKVLEGCSELLGM